MHGYSIWQLALSALAILGLWAVALATALLAALSTFSSFSGSQGDPLAILVVSSVCLVASLLLLPAVLYALERLSGRSWGAWLAPLYRLRPTVLIFLLPFVLAVGSGVKQVAPLAWIVFPPLHILAIGLPILWVLYLAVHGLPLGSRQCMWGVFGSGLVMGPTLIIIAEGLAALVVLVLAILALSGSPELVDELTTLAEWVSRTSPSQQELFDALTPYLVNPAVIGLSFFFMALVIPLIEEFLKPVGVWLLMGRKMRPAAGFAAGALSGAGFALLESLFTYSEESWALMAVARTGTAMVHILTSGLVGWGLVQAWGQKKYLRLALAYAGAVAVHGLWNGMSLLAVFSALAAQVQLGDSLSSLSTGLQIVAALCLMAMAVGAFLSLTLINKRLRGAGLLADAGNPETPPSQNAKDSEPNLNVTDVE
ncbi:MAG: PrsW family glutamic-type intramembrane protease [Chloroflexota bacterium]